MARIRTIKPEFWQNESLASCSPHARLLAIAALQLADSSGRLLWIPMQVHAHAFPFEPGIDITDLARELVEIGYLSVYEHGGKKYAEVTNFIKHQRLSGKEADYESNIPSPRDDGSSCIFHSEAKGKTQALPREAHGIPGKGTGNREREQGKGTGNTSSATAPDKSPDPDPTDLIFEHWQRVHDHPKARLDDKRRKLINRAMKLGYTANDLRLAISGCSKSPFHMGDNDGGTRYDGLDLILRDASKIDQFIGFYHNPPTPRGKQGRVEALNQQAVDDFLSGDDPFASPSDIETEYTVEG